MGLAEHLAELRSTLIRILIILLVAFAFCYSIGEGALGNPARPSALHYGGENPRKNCLPLHFR